MPLDTGVKPIGTFKLLRHFSWACAIALIMTAIALLVVYRDDQIEEFRISAQDDNVRLTNRFRGTFLDQFRPFLSKAGGLSPEVLRRRGELRALDIAFDGLSSGLPVLRVRVYDEEGRALYSTDRDEVGGDFSADDGVENALRDRLPWTRLGKVRGMADRFIIPADRWVAETCVPLTTETGQVIGGLAVFSDVTPSMRRLEVGVAGFGLLLLLVFSALYGVLLLVVRRADRIMAAQRAEIERAGEELRAKEQRFRAIADYTFDWESWLDRDGRLQWVNPAVERVAGYSIAHCLEMADYPLSAVYEPDRPVVRRLKERALSEHFETGAEFRLICRNGLVKWVMASFQPIYDDSGRSMGSRWSIRDISDRKKAEQRLAESEVRFRSVTQTAADAIVSVDSHGVIVSWNLGAERIFGWSEAEASGRDVTLIMPPAYRERHSAALQRLAHTGEAPLVGTPILLEGLRRDGTIFPVELSLSRWEVDEESFFSAVIRDVTERRRAEKELAARTVELERSNAELQQFAYAASHDLQEPLRTVTSFLQLLNRRYGTALDDQAKEYIGFAVDGAARMHRLITDLLTYSRVTTHGRTFAKVSMEKVLDVVLGNLGAAITEAGAEIARGPLPEIDADEAQMVSLMQNLVGNAVKYRAKDTVPRIEVTAEAEGGAWVFSVRDNGIGIDPKFFDRVFVIFQRLHARNEYEGTGIGLAVAKKIVERHGGRIWVDSTPGQGSTFRFALPTRHDA